MARPRDGGARDGRPGWRDRPKRARRGTTRASRVAIPDDGAGPHAMERHLENVFGVAGPAKLAKTSTDEDIAETRRRMGANVLVPALRTNARTPYSPAAVSLLLERDRLLVHLDCEGGVATTPLLAHRRIHVEAVHQVSERQIRSSA